MATTPNYAFPYPSENDPPNGAAQIGALASAVDTKLKVVENGAVYTCTSTTRPTPTKNRLIYETDTQKYMIADGSAWGYWSSSDHIIAKTKSTNQSKGSTTTLANDSELVATVTANAKYRLELALIHQSPSSGDLKVRLVGPALATCRFVVQTVYVGGTVYANDQIFSRSLNDLFTSAGIPGEQVPVFCQGHLVIGSVGGTFAAQWAQNTSNAASSTVLAGSFLNLIRYA